MKQIISLLFVLWFGVASLTAQKKQKSFTKEFYFASAKFELDSIEKVKAKKFKKLISKFNLSKVSIIGYTDNDGSDSYNLNLSKQRISTLQTFLSDSTTDSLFITNPKGEKDPDYENEGENKFKNRRVKVIAYYSSKKGKKSKQTKKKKSHPIVKPKPKPNIVAAEKEIRIEKKDLKKGNVINLPSVNFHGGTAEFLPGAEEILGKVAPLLIANPDVKVEIAGHICCGNDMKLSKERARRVYLFLIRNGVKSDNLTYKGYNNTQPKFGNIMDIRNRRVELRVL